MRSFGNSLPGTANRGFKNLGGVGILLELGDSLPANQPPVCEWGRNAAACRSKFPGVKPERHNVFVSAIEVVRRRREFFPIRCKSREKVIDDCLRVLPNSAVVRKALRFFPLEIGRE